MRKLLLLLLLLISVASAQKSVRVRQYTRKDGTVVSAHERSAPKSTTAATPKASAVRPPATRKPAPTATKGHTATAVVPQRRNAQGRIARSATAKRQFEASHPCPTTGRTGACPGYVVDHIKPLACGGADSPNNMQWQSVAAAKAKDKWERAGCGK